MFNTTSRGIKKLHRLLGEGKTVWVLYLDLIKFHEVEFRHGNKVCKRILEELYQEIELSLKRQSRFFTMSMVEERGGDDFVVYFVPKPNVPWKITEVTENWVHPLEQRFNNRIRGFINEKLQLRSAIVQCVNESGRTVDYLLYAAIKEAFLLNKAEPDAQYFGRREEVKHLLKSPNNYLRTAFQPILQIQTGEIFGFEALTRVLGAETFSNIVELLTFAENIGQLYPVETLCRRISIESSSRVLQQHEFLFLNINPQVLLDPEFASGQTRKLLLEQALHPSNVVLEITERSAIEDFDTFRQALAHYRNQGYLIALDDVGAGYSSLQSIAELHPDFLKVDRSLISSINTDPTKWALLEAFVTFSKRIGARIIAEGVETEDEMRAVVQLGVDYVQGYYLARPSFERPKINEDALDVLKRQYRNKSSEHSIFSLVEPLQLFEKATLIRTIQDYFQDHLNSWLIGVTDNEKIVGIVKREKLFAALGSRYGVSLYLNKSIPLLMENDPLIVEDSTPIEIVSRLAMERPDTQLYNGIVVVNQQKPIGMVSVAALMKAISDRQIQIARGANPLTGLPGNLLIDREIQRRLALKSTFGIIYVDLNKFKHYNDVNGFKRGDQAIKMTGDVLLDTALLLDEEAFIGHIGGDDFIIMLKTEQLENCCRGILSEFAHQRQSLLRAQGLSIALASLAIPAHTSLEPVSIAELAAQVKKEVKQIGGDAFLVRNV